MKRQSGLVLVLSLLVLMSITILGVSAVSSSLLQTKMASSVQQNGLAFNAAEAAISGVVYESEDKDMLAHVLLDPLSEARQASPYNPTIQDMKCSDSASWVNRHVTSDGLKNQTQHTVEGDYHSLPKTKSWSRTAFVREQSCRGSSNVVGGVNINCHVFIIRGCGSVEGQGPVVANTLAASVFAPASQ